jgi:RNA polymerase sigma-70 factor (ECF subfamily)
MADFRLKAEDAGRSAGLLERARAGDLEAFDQVMRLHEKQVLGTALRLLGNLEDAQDAAQETFLRLYRSLNRLPVI